MIKTLLHLQERFVINLLKPYFRVCFVRVVLLII
ncbi:MAG: hypothetical protein JWQ84_2644 [Mucilaginibacter sp.]|nr:hypothetical protein [Mucilaginibacter sp.]